MKEENEIEIEQDEVRPNFKPVEKDRPEFVEHKIQLYPCSPQAERFIDKTLFDGQGCCPDKGKYPFNSMKIGQSFSMELDRLAYSRSLVCTKSRTSGKKFKVFIHDELSIIEVARIK